MTGLAALAWLASAGSALHRPLLPCAGRGARARRRLGFDGTRASGKITVDDCAAGGSLRAFFDPAAPHGGTTSIGLSFKAPADTTISAYDIDRRVRLSKASAG